MFQKTRRFTANKHIHKEDISYNCNVIVESLILKTFHNYNI